MVSDSDRELGSMINMIVCNVMDVIFIQEYIRRPVSSQLLNFETMSICVSYLKIFIFLVHKVIQDKKLDPNFAKRGCSSLVSLKGLPTMTFQISVKSM